MVSSMRIDIVVVRSSAVAVADSINAQEVNCSYRTNLIALHTPQLYPQALPRQQQGFTNLIKAAKEIHYAQFVNSLDTAIWCRVLTNDRHFASFPRSVS